MAASESKESSKGTNFNFSWQQTMLRVRSVMLACLFDATYLPFFTFLSPNPLSPLQSAYPSYTTYPHSHTTQIKDPAKSLPFYEDVLGFKRLHTYKFDSFSLYFMYIPKPGETVRDHFMKRGWDHRYMNCIRTALALSRLPTPSPFPLSPPPSHSFIHSHTRTCPLLIDSCRRSAGARSRRSSCGPCPAPCWN